MEGESQNIEQIKNHREIMLAVAIVMFQFIATIFLHIEAFIFYFPSGSTFVSQSGNILFCDLKISYPAIMIKLLARSFILLPDFKEIYDTITLPIERHLSGNAITSQ